MAPRKPKVIEVALGGKHRSVVQSKPDWWVEQLPEGDHVLHYGRLWDRQQPLQMLETPKPCTRCKRPAEVATSRGRAHHPQCEGWLEVLPDQSVNTILFGIAADLDARIRREA